MAEHGGYRQPSNPAPVSGPGAHSARTDRGPKQYDVTGQSYGDAQAFEQAQSASPLSPPSGAPGGTAPAGLDLSGLVGLGAPSSMPDVPVTDGAAAGAGLGPEALQNGPTVSPESEEARALGKWLPVMISASEEDGATPAFKRYVRELIRNLP